MSAPLKHASRGGRWAVIGVPYFWLLLFFMLPFLIVLKISVSEMETVTFKDVLTFKDGVLEIGRAHV